MIRFDKLALLLFSALVVAVGPGLAQQSNPPQSGSSATETQAPEAQPGDSSPDQAAPNAAAPAGSACWQQAGIPKKAMRTRQAIMTNAKAQIQKVNDDTSLTPQQQRRQIRQIRQNAKQQIGKVISPEQETALQECQRLRKERSLPPDSSRTNPPATEPN